MELPRDTVELEVDALRISQVVGNLLTNAAKYTDHGGRIVVAAWRHDAELLIRVTDNGVGLERQDLDRLFKMFSQLPTGAGRSQGGLGIGLSLSRGLVRLHGGNIEADSAGAGRGSAFTVHLPASCLLSTPAARTPEPRGAAVAAAAPGSDGIRVLIADDNVDAAESLGELLRLIGYQVRVAHDGEQALRAFERDQPGFVLLDIGMPHLSGLQVARAIRDRPAAQRPVIVAISGRGQARDRFDALEAGFDFHLTKPVDPGAIQALIDRSGRPVPAAGYR